MRTNNQRKPKTPVSEHAKDAKYYEYRKKNNLKAAINRQKKREEYIKFKSMLFQEERRNSILKLQVQNLKEQLAILVKLYRIKQNNNSIFLNSVMNNY
jgi:hypothetical protein